MRTNLTQIGKTLSVVCAFLLIDFVIVPACHDTSQITNKFLVLDYLEYMNSTPEVISEAAHDLRRLPAWLTLPGFDIIKINNVEKDTAEVLLNNSDGQSINGIVQMTDITGPNSHGIAFSIKDYNGDLLIEYRLTLQSVANEVRVAHLAALPYLRRQMVRSNPGATARLRARMLQTHKRLETLILQ